MHLKNNRAIKGKALARSIYAVFDTGTVRDMFEEYHLWCMDNDERPDISIAEWLSDE